MVSLVNIFINTDKETRIVFDINFSPFSQACSEVW